MSQKNKFVKKGHIYRTLVASALIANGIFQFVAPVLAEGTAAGQTIDNTATATYEDPNNPGVPINATSNTVTVAVAEVAGITVVGAGPVFKNDANGDGNFNARDEFYFVYDVENVGNDPTKFRIPGTPTVLGEGTLNGLVQISYDGTTWIDVQAAGATTDSVKPGDVVKVRVPVTVNDNAPSNAKISVELGDTDPDAQNQLYVEYPVDPNIYNDPNNKNVFTVDNTETENGDVTGNPVNGVRESSATQEITVDSSLTTYALAKILKTNSNYQSAGATGPIGDTLDYNLRLEVLNTDPTGNNISPVALQGKAVPGLTGNNILVSDAIPAGTNLKTVTAPPGWTAVYSLGDPKALPGNKANAATWQTTVPSDLSTVGRVGFVKTGSVDPNTIVTGFKIKVEVTSELSSVTVANVAQLFGATPNGKDVYDESGDAQPSNYDEDNQSFPGTGNTPGQVPTTIAPADIDDGYIDLTDAGDGDTGTTPNGTPDELEGPNGYGTDVNNDNSGTGKGGEANVFKINAVGVSSVLNGPNGAPTANVGGDNNIDFTNKSATVAKDDSKPDSKINPGSVSFTNTVQNTGNSNADIILKPQVPATPGDLPDGTTVTITYDNNGTNEIAVYTYDTDTVGSEKFALTSSTRTIPDPNNAGATIPAPIKILAVPSNATKNYTVDVNLPENTDLSTNDGTEKGSPVPIRAFVDNDNDGDADPIDTDNDGTPDTPAQNVTINRVYVGYLKLVKTSRILNSEGQPKFPTDGSFDNTNKSPKPGDIIEYKIEYQNISEVAGGPGNVVLNANKVVITEDGTTGGNNWALDNDDDKEIDTINIPGKAVAATATINYAPSGDNENVTAYTVASQVAPGVTKTFTFQRRVNSVSPTGTAKNPPAPTLTPTPNPNPS